MIFYLVMAALVVLLGLYVGAVLRTGDWVVIAIAALCWPIFFIVVVVMCIMEWKNGKV